MASDISLLRVQQVKARLGCGRTKLYELVSSGQLAPPLKLFGGRNVAWPSNVIDDFIAKQIDADAAGH